MGRAIVRLASSHGVEVVCAIAASDVGTDVGKLAGIDSIGVRVSNVMSDLEKARADVAVDFSTPKATVAFAKAAASAKMAIVSGTTGLGDEERGALEEAARIVAVLWEPNTSIGIHVLSDLVARASAALRDWDIEIVETHHAAKIDAPSGTALRLAEAARGARQASTRLAVGRSGQTGKRAPGEIGVHALRGGDVVGDHVVHLIGAGERLELTHRATTRDVFAHGALRAARWVAGKPEGMYGLKDVLRPGAS
jgi:4-hydroxy-tetrahydrodipicolinate reductase